MYLTFHHYRPSMQSTHLISMGALTTIPTPCFFFARVRVVADHYDDDISFIIEPRDAQRTITNCLSSGTYQEIQHLIEYIEEDRDSAYVRVSSEFLDDSHVPPPQHVDDDEFLGELVGGCCY